MSAYSWISCLSRLYLSQVINDSFESKVECTQGRIGKFAYVDTERAVIENWSWKSRNYKIISPQVAQFNDIVLISTRLMILTWWWCSLGRLLPSSQMAFWARGHAAGFAPAHRSVWAPPSDGCLQYGWNTSLMTGSSWLVILHHDLSPEPHKNRNIKNKYHKRA